MAEPVVSISRPSPGMAILVSDPWYLLRARPLEDKASTIELISRAVDIMDLRNAQFS
jgi:hypothetical protein